MAILLRSINKQSQNFSKFLRLDFINNSRLNPRCVNFHTSDIDKQSSYISDKAYINGKWISTDKTFEVYNPFNEEVIGSSADCDVGLAETAIEAADNALGPWKGMTAKERSNIMKKWYDLIMKDKDGLAELVTLENGKPILQSATEILYAASFVEWYAEEGKRTYGITMPTVLSGKKMMTLKQPIGVVSMITPWNFPAAMITRKACAALAAGCTVILKPSEETPFSALAFAKLAEDAGLPPGVLNIIPSSRSNVASVGELLCSHPSIAAVSFTGSTATGKVLLRHAASTVKKMSLENGGNAPFIVFDSSDIKKAVQGALACKFRYSGQTCICANRILVQSGIHDEFVAQLAKAIKNELIIGNGMDSRTTFGPLINAAAVNKVEEQVNDAVKHGANVVVGGSRSSIGKNLYEPTLLTGVTTAMQCCQYETFGPIAPIVKFHSEEEAIEIANNTTSGLAGYVYSGDVAQCWRVAENLEYGVVGINEGLISAAEAPFGGYKESGLGREGSIYGMDEFMEVKYLCWGV
uniref:succinate-semialdehyde dehydrogenase, mitochondrial-like n=1 Tax=Styela clava TaxID=7725 RepID=UPI0019397909|nr:succinate-semialdehyde dehydrogenase, mitochondrial-like [Styela clava]